MHPRPLLSYPSPDEAPSEVRLMHAVHQPTARVYPRNSLTLKNPAMANSGIHSLPVELLVRVFEFGRAEDPPADLHPPGEPTFEVLVSHICKYWRDVAIRTPSLWTTIYMRTVSHMQRVRHYLSRSGSLLLDIFVDTCAEEEYAPGLLFQDEFLEAFHIVLPHIDRWYSLTLKVRDLTCKRHARAILSQCGSAARLHRLTLWHIEDWGTSERLFTAIGPPPVIVFGGSLPCLREVRLIGVNLPWDQSPFLRDLRSIEFALHSDDVRIPFTLWHKMLDGSPALERLSLTYSGPRAGARDWAPPARVSLPALAELRLTDLDPPYLCALMRTLDAPNLRTLHLELSEQDFTPFVQVLVAPPPPSDGPFDPLAAWVPPASRRNAKPLFPRLETLSLSALECSLNSLHALLASAPRLRHLEAAFERMPGGALDLLIRHAAGPLPSALTADADGDKGKAREPELDAALLPELVSVRLAGVGGVLLRALMAARRAAGRAVGTWYVHDKSWDEECEHLMLECERTGVVERVIWYEGEEGAEADLAGEEDSRAGEGEE